MSKKDKKRDLYKNGRTGWDQGYDASNRGAYERDNPYDSKKERDLHSGWSRGWHDHHYQSQEDNYCGGY